MGVVQMRDQPCVSRHAARNGVCRINGTYRETEIDSDDAGSSTSRTYVLGVVR